MPQAISYIRFSAKIQEKGSSIARQLAMRESWLNDHPTFTLSSLSEQDIARSASKGVHLKHGLGRILEAIDQGLIKGGDYIIVESIDRLGRLSQVEMLQIITDIVNAKVSIVTLEDNQTYSLETLNNNSSSIFILVGKIQQAHDYTAALSRRIAAAYERKRLKAVKGESIALNTPMWLTTSGKLIPQKSEMLRACIQLYLKGYGLRKIIKALKDDYPAISEVGERTIKRWFNNPALIGQWKNKGSPIDGVFEPLISLDTYYKLQAELKRRSKTMSPEEVYRISGLVFCQRCGARFYFRRKLYKGEYIVYANCSTYLKKGGESCGNNTTWPYQALEYLCSTTYSHHLSTAAIDTVSKEALKELDVLVNQQNETKQLLDNSTRLLIEQPKNPSLKEQSAELTSKYEQLGKKISVLKEQLDTQSPTILTAESMQSRYRMELEAQLDPIYMRDILQKIGYKVFVNGRESHVSLEEVESSEGVCDMKSTLTLLRHSTAHKCYILQDVTDFRWGENKEYKSKSSLFVAINKYGTTLEAETEKELIQELLERKGSFSEELNHGREYDKALAVELLERLSSVEGADNLSIEEFIDQFPGEVITP